MKRLLGAATFALAVLLAERAVADPSVAVVEARALGVLPASAAAVTRQLYATVARLGYRTADESTTAALSSHGAPNGLTPAELLQVATGAHVEHALGATLGATNGQYVVTVTLANADRTGPYSGTAATTSESLEPTVDRIVRALLPPAPPVATSQFTESAPPSPSPRSTMRLALQTEGALGIASHLFYNQLVGARLDYGFTEDVALGAYVGYANLKGKDGRVSNVLPYLQLEYRIHPAKTGTFRIPVRFGTGYLPKNGPFLRLATGPNFQVGDTAHLGFDLIAPTLWIVRNSIVASMDIAAEIAFDFDPPGKSPEGGERSCRQDD